MLELHKKVKEKVDVLERFHCLYHPQRPILVHLPPISLLQRGKKQIESSFQGSDHTLPCSTLWFFNGKADGHVWKEEGLLAAEDWKPKGIYCRTKKNTTPISAVVNNKKGFIIFKFTDGNKICGCDL